MIITIPTAEHEGLHRRLDERVVFAATLMGLGWEYTPVGSTTFHDRDINGNITSAGEGDSCRKPTQYGRANTNIQH